MTETLILSPEATRALRDSGMERPLADFTGDLQRNADEAGITYVVKDSHGELLDVVEPKVTCRWCGAPGPRGEDHDGDPVCFGCFDGMESISPGGTWTEGLACELRRAREGV